MNSSKVTETHQENSILAKCNGVYQPGGYIALDMLVTVQLIYHLQTLAIISLLNYYKMFI